VTDIRVQTAIGEDLYQLINRLFPICRSITGNGVRQSLEIMQEYLPIQVNEVPTGTAIFDWTIPKEWNISDAYIKNRKGEKLVDFNNSNLHVLNYSIPVKGTFSIQELKQHIFSMPEKPEWIPYRTSYYDEKWGFCLSHSQWQTMQDEEYEVCIDSTLEPGSLTYGEFYLPGQTEEECLFSCHICHPSLCNDNLSGIAVVLFLAKMLSTRKNRLSYRFLFIPGTIGAITWLALNENKLSNIKAGLVATLLGDPSPFTYKKTRSGDSLIDKAVIHYLKFSGDDYRLIEFFPYGYDERQFNSPGINLPVGSLTRSQYGQYPEYHTSADNLELVTQEKLEDSLKAYLSISDILDNNIIYINQYPKCEPQLGKRGLYQKNGGTTVEDKEIRRMAMLWCLNFSDGKHSLLDIADRAAMPFEVIKQVAAILEENGMLTPLKTNEN
jgi:aminopeptidase-like protein